MTEFSKRIIYLVNKHHRGNGSEMARGLGMAHNTLVSKWMQGNADYSKKYSIAICQKYNVTQRWLRGDDPIEAEAQQTQIEDVEQPQEQMISERDYYQLEGRYKEIKEQFERNQDRLLLIVERLESKLMQDTPPAVSDKNKEVDTQHKLIMTTHQRGSNTGQRNTGSERVSVHDHSADPVP